LKVETLKAIQKAVIRAESLHPEFPEDRIYQGALLAEESGEAIQEANDIVHTGKDEGFFIMEVLDTIAVGVRILDRWYEENDR
jgi:hypothetical protein